MADFWAFLILGLLILSLGLVITIKRKANLLRRYKTVKPEERAAYAFYMGIIFSGLGVFCIVMALFTRFGNLAEQTFSAVFLSGLGLILVVFIIFQRRFINKHVEEGQQAPRNRFLR